LKVLNFKISFQDIEKVLNLAKTTLGIKKVWKFKMEKKSEEVCENFTEGKAIHYLFRVIRCVKLSFMTKNFKNEEK